MAATSKTEYSSCKNRKLCSVILSSSECSDASDFENCSARKKPTLSKSKKENAPVVKKALFSIGKKPGNKKSTKHKPEKNPLTRTKHLFNSSNQSFSEFLSDTSPTDKENVKKKKRVVPTKYGCRKILSENNDEEDIGRDMKEVIESIHRLKLPACSQSPMLTDYSCLNASVASNDNTGIDICSITKDQDDVLLKANDFHNPISMDCANITEPCIPDDKRNSCKGMDEADISASSSFHPSLKAITSLSRENKTGLSQGKIFNKQEMMVADEAIQFNADASTPITCIGASAELDVQHEFINELSSSNTIQVINETIDKQEENLINKETMFEETIISLVQQKTPSSVSSAIACDRQDSISEADKLASNIEDVPVSSGGSNSESASIVKIANQSSLDNDMAENFREAAANFESNVLHFPNALSDSVETPSHVYAGLPIPCNKVVSEMVMNELDREMNFKSCTESDRDEQLTVNSSRGSPFESHSDTDSDSSIMKFSTPFQRNRIDSSSSISSDDDLWCSALDHKSYSISKPRKSIEAETDVQNDGNTKDFIKLNIMGETELPSHSVENVKNSQLKVDSTPVSFHTPAGTSYSRTPHHLSGRKLKPICLSGDESSEETETCSISKTPLQCNAKLSTPFKFPTKCTFLKSLSPAVEECDAHSDAIPFRKHFKTRKEELTIYLFSLYNEKVFQNKLPADMLIEWNIHLTKTAGYTNCQSKNGVRKCQIALSDKVLDSADRLRDTLLHEMCHAAVWLVNGKNDKHGPFWQAWACRCKMAFPEVNMPKRCHNYHISYKYIYKCTRCGAAIGRHSRSINTATSYCNRCGGKIYLSKK